MRFCDRAPAQRQNDGKQWAVSSEQTRIGLRADRELQARIEELARKSTEGELTEDERAEYVGYVRANKFVAIIKRQAQHLANSQP